MPGRNRFEPRKRVQSGSRDGCRIGSKRGRNRLRRLLDAATWRLLTSSRLRCDFPKRAVDQSRTNASATAPARPRPRPNRIRNELRPDQTSCMALVSAPFRGASSERKRAFGRRLWSLRPQIVQTRCLCDEISLHAALGRLVRAGPQDQCENPQAQKDQRALPREPFMLAEFVFAEVDISLVADHGKIPFSRRPPRP
jgi:hypothetical protein